MNTKGSIFTHWLFSEFAPLNKSLPIFRVIYASFVLIVIMPRHLWLASYPDTFFLPSIGLTFFFSGLPEAWLFYLLNFLLVLSLLALLFGYKTFYSSLSVALLLIIGNSWEYSLGKINHDILLVLIPLLMAGSCWNREIGTNQKGDSAKSWPIAIFTLLLGLAMFTAALPKILSGWLDPSVSALTGQMVQNYFETDRQTFMSSFLLANYNFYLFKLLDYATIFVELAFIFTIFSLRYFRMACALACLFHLGVQLSLGISFPANIIAYGVFVDWTKLYDIGNLRKVFDKLHSFSQSISFFALLGISIPIWLVFILIGNPFSFDPGVQYIFGGNLINTAIKVTAAIIALNYLFQLVIRKGFTSQEVSYSKVKA